MISNTIKEFEEIAWELSSLGAKIIFERIKDNLDKFEMKMLKTKVENKMKALN